MRHASGGSPPGREGGASRAAVALIGLPGAGKTVVAPLLAARWGGAAIDLDAAIERATGRSVPDLLRAEGEAAFRARELDALRGAAGGAAAVAAPGLEGPLVLSCGGGLVTNAASREALRAFATVVWLQVTPEAALERLGASGVERRPLLGNASGPGDPLERLRALLASREPLYRELAAVAVDTTGRSPEEVAAAVERRLRERWAGSAS
jgi:shikimate kinase